MEHSAASTVDLQPAQSLPENHLRHRSLSSFPYGQEIFDAERQNLEIIEKKIKKLRNKAFDIDDLCNEVHRYTITIGDKYFTNAPPSHEMTSEITGEVLTLIDAIHKSLGNVDRITSAVQRNTSILLKKVAKGRQCIDSLCVFGWDLGIGDEPADALKAVGVQAFRNRVDKPMRKMLHGLVNAVIVLTEAWDELEYLENWSRIQRGDTFYDAGYSPEAYSL
ncbi:hypothetical protein QBC41DRAFT_395881 [Cercophora samala]|uniref:Uncharacterized protein n=1 Tax=Cercophora samala TaxID=330535 RepID=A0AA40DA61_9PEZI|nr:hypothetical protein QBC41DRAFT_395881 [Cercophora samala]